MLVMSFDLDPLQQSVMIVVIERDNLDRMRQADPITLESKPGGGVINPPKYPENYSLLIAYEDDSDELYKVAAEVGRGAGPYHLLRFLERRRRFIPAVDGKANTVSLVAGANAAEEQRGPLAGGKWPEESGPSQRPAATEGNG